MVVSIRFQRTPNAERTINYAHFNLITLKLSVIHLTQTAVTLAVLHFGRTIKKQLKWNNLKKEMFQNSIKSRILLKSAQRAVKHGQVFKNSYFKWQVLVYRSLNMHCSVKSIGAWKSSGRTFIASYKFRYMTVAFIFPWQKYYSERPTKIIGSLDSSYHQSEMNTTRINFSFSINVILVNCFGAWKPWNVFVKWP